MLGVGRQAATFPPKCELVSSPASPLAVTVQKYQKIVFVLHMQIHLSTLRSQFLFDLPFGLKLSKALDYSHC